MLLSASHASVAPVPNYTMNGTVDNNIAGMMGQSGMMQPAPNQVVITITKATAQVNEIFSGPMSAQSFNQVPCCPLS